MYCEQSETLLPLLALGELDAERAAGLEAHLADCPACRAKLADLGATLQLLEEAVSRLPDAHLSAERRKALADVAAGQSETAATPNLAKVSTNLRKVQSTADAPPSSDRPPIYRIFPVVRRAFRSVRNRKVLKANPVVEAIAALFIVAILAALILPSFGLARARARSPRPPQWVLSERKQSHSNLGQIDKTTTVYEERNGELFPATAPAPAPSAPAPMKAEEFHAQKMLGGKAIVVPITPSVPGGAGGGGGGIYDAARESGAPLAGARLGTVLYPGFKDNMKVFRLPSSEDGQAGAVATAGPSDSMYSDGHVVFRDVARDWRGTVGNLSGGDAAEVELFAKEADRGAVVLDGAPPEASERAAQVADDKDMKDYMASLRARDRREKVDGEWNTGAIAAGRTTGDEYAKSIRAPSDVHAKGGPARDEAARLATERAVNEAVRRDRERLAQEDTGRSNVVTEEQMLAFATQQAAPSPFVDAQKKLEEPTGPIAGAIVTPALPTPKPDEAADQADGRIKWREKLVFPESVYQYPAKEVWDETVARNGQARRSSEEKAEASSESSVINLGTAADAAVWDGATAELPSARAVKTPVNLRLESFLKKNISALSLPAIPFNEAMSAFKNTLPPGVEMVVDPKLQADKLPPITVDLKDVSVNTALRAMLRPKGLDYVVSDGRLLIIKAETAAPEQAQPTNVSPAPATPPPEVEQPPQRPAFKAGPVNPWVMAAKDALSTFGIDVDTASYAIARNYIARGMLPPAASVRMEEYVNAFDYNYPTQSSGVFSVHAEAAPSPFGAQGLTLLKVGVRARVVGRDARKPANLVFVVDASGSMEKPDRMPLVKFALRSLVEKLDPRDRVSLVTFGTHSLIVLESVTASHKMRIIEAVEGLRCGGSTNLLEGLELGYELAARRFAAGAVNRVVLCSDGIANIGATDADAMLARVEAFRRQGVTLTAAGCGFGAYDDVLLERLANKGDGNYVFLDTEAEAQRVFVEEMAATLQTVAADAKIQVSFDPARVRRYRLIGFENRDIADADFRNDTVDAGEVGSGQSSTALYELELLPPPQDAGRAADLGTVFVRYRDTETGRVEEIAQPLSGDIVRPRTVEESPRFYLAACAAQFAEVLRGSEHARNGSLAQVRPIIQSVAAELPLDPRVQELASLIYRADGLPRAE